MQYARYFWFGLSILLGVLMGLFLGSRLIPAPYENLSMSNLRDDYKTDYILMVAEGFVADGNIQHAAEMITPLGPETPLHQVQQARVKARELNYSSADLELMLQLAQALQSITPTQTVVP